MSAVVSDVFLDAKGDPLEGSVVFTPDSAVFALAGIVPPSPVVAVLDEAGAFTVELQATDTGNPSGWTYLVQERVKGGRTYHAAAPTGTRKLSQLAPVPAAAGNPIVKGDKGDPNVLTVGTVTTVADGVPAAVSITGTSPAQVINLTLPAGPTGMARVDHGTDGSVARPNKGLVYWVGSARPVNALPSDLWMNG